METTADLMELIVRPGTFVLALAVVIVTFFTKRIVEIVRPGWKASKGASDGDEPKEVVKVQRYTNNMALWWNEVIIYAVPILYGMLLGSIASEFLHGPANEQVGTRLMWSAGVSWFASFFYKIFRKMVLQKTGVDVQPGSIAPPPPGAGT